jgi:copper chaperone CopZ
MKSIKKLIYTSILLVTIISSVLQVSAKDNIKTAEFKVEGVCDMCKARIENGALIKGVKKADWDKETGMITVIYNSKKVTLMEIHEAIAEVGHRTDKVEAKESAYTKLPACCQYDDGADTH